MQLFCFITFFFLFLQLTQSTLMGQSQSLRAVVLDISGDGIDRLRREKLVGTGKVIVEGSIDTPHVEIVKSGVPFAFGRLLCIGGKYIQKNGKKVEIWDEIKKSIGKWLTHLKEQPNTVIMLLSDLSQDERIRSRQALKRLISDFSSLKNIPLTIYAPHPIQPPTGKAVPGSLAAVMSATNLCASFKVKPSGNSSNLVLTTTAAPQTNPVVLPYSAADMFKFIDEHHTQKLVSQATEPEPKQEQSPSALLGYVMSLLGGKAKSFQKQGGHSLTLGILGNTISVITPGTVVPEATLTALSTSVGGGNPLKPSQPLTIGIVPMSSVRYGRDLAREKSISYSLGVAKNTISDDQMLLRLVYSRGCLNVPYYVAVHIQSYLYLPCLPASHTAAVKVEMTSALDAIQWAAIQGQLHDQQRRKRVSRNSKKKPNDGSMSVE